MPIMSASRFAYRYIGLSLEHGGDKELFDSYVLQRGNVTVPGLGILKLEPLRMETTNLERLIHPASRDESHLLLENA